MAIPLCRSLPVSRATAVARVGRRRAAPATVYCSSSSSTGHGVAPSLLPAGLQGGRPSGARVEQTADSLAAARSPDDLEPYVGWGPAGRQLARLPTLLATPSPLTRAYECLFHTPRGKGLLMLNALVFLYATNWCVARPAVPHAGNIV